MRRLLAILLGIFVISSGANLFASTYLKFWVNGVQSNIITQGDMLAWEMDVATPGSAVTIELYLDLDGSHTISAADLLLERFQLQDGGAGGDGPSDSSGTPDGIIYVDFGPFGFAPQNYMMKVTDQDNSTVTNWFIMEPMLNPPATISGNVNIEGVLSPDPIYENIMIGAEGTGLFSGLTDNNGLYTINLPVADSTWSVEIFFRNTVPGFIAQDTTYQITAPAGNTGSIDFNYTKPRAWVYGDLKDENGNIPDRQIHIGLENQTTGSESSAMLDNGHYNLPAAIEIFGNDSTNYFQLHLDADALIPDYLVPRDNEPFPLSIGDSLEKNLTAYTTDALIYGYVKENGGAPSQSYLFSAVSDTFGYTQTMSGQSSGYFELSVKNGTEYRAGLQDDPDWGTPLLPGYIISGGNWRNAEPGDTLYFDMVRAGNLLAGNISFDPGDPTIFDFNRNRITAWDTSSSANYGTRVDNSLHYELPVANGVYHLNFDPEVNNYLVMPWQYNFINVTQDTVDTLNFLLNYAHAHLTIKLTNAPIPAWFNGYGIRTEGNDPYIYSTWGELQPDSTIQLRVCEGEWNLGIPFYDPNYVVTPGDTTLVVTENDSSFYIEFIYKSLTGINREEKIPGTFYLGQNYPNPFNPKTTINYQLPSGSQVDLSIYNLLGQKVATLVSEKIVAGSYKVEWNASAFASGVYFYKLETNTGFVQTKKLILLK